MELKLTNKTALITGASKGIGLAVAEVFAAEGCHLHLAARNGEAMLTAKQDLEARHGVKVTIHALDLSGTAAMEQLAAAVGDIDILINNAGDIDVFYDVNQEFHEAIYEASRNAFLADQTRKLRNQVAAYRRRVTRMPNRIADTVREHEAIMQAILAHDPERAHSTMRDHVNLLGDNLLDFLAAFK